MNPQHFQIDSPIHRSAFFGDRAGLEYLVELGVDVNSCISLSQEQNLFLQELTPLMLAAWSTAGATVETLHWLIQHGANPHTKSAAQVTAAWYAIANPSWWNDPEHRNKNDRLNRLEYLLSLGISPLEHAWNNSTLLTEACRTGSSDCVSLLLKSGMSANPVDNNNESFSSDQIPLFSAASSGSTLCVSSLLQAGADIHVRDHWNRTALMYAKSAEVVQILLEAGIDLYTTQKIDDEFCTSLDALDFILEDLFSNELGIVERSKIALCLISAGLDIDRKNNFYNTRLYTAAFNTNEFAVDFLIKNGANPHLKSSDGASPLHGVCWGSDKPYYPDWQPSQGKIRIIEKLLESEIDIDIVDDHGYSPIHEAVFGDGGNLTALKTLLQHDANPNTVTHKKISPLMLAAMEGELECMQTLLAASADLTMADFQELTAADYAIEYYEKLLEEGNARHDGSLEYLIQRALECIWLLK
jgi:ankyrin repeat protein